MSKIVDFFKGVKSEYSKIVFPNMDTLKKDTTATIVISVIIGLMIFLLDMGMKYLLGLIL